MTTVTLNAENITDEDIGKLPVENPQVKDEVFVALMDLYISANLSRVSASEDAVIRDFLDAEARTRGYDDWVHAFYRLAVHGRV